MNTTFFALIRCIRRKFQNENNNKKNASNLLKNECEMNIFIVWNQQQENRIKVSMFGVCEFFFSSNWKHFELKKEIKNSRN